MYNEEWVGFYTAHTHNCESFINKIFEIDNDLKIIQLREQQEVNIKYPYSDPVKFYRYNSLFLIPKPLYDYITFLNNFIKTWYETQNKESLFTERFTSLYLSGTSQCGKTTIFRLLGPCSECNKKINIRSISYNTPFTLFNDHDPKENDKTKGYYLDFSQYKAFFGCNDYAHYDDKWLYNIEVPTNRPFIFTNNNIPEFIFSPQSADYVKSNSLIINLDKENDVDIKADTNNFKQFGKKNRIMLKKKLILNGPITKWIYYDPKSCYYFRNILDFKKACEINSIVYLNSGCYEHSYVTKAPVNSKHGTYFQPVYYNMISDINNSNNPKKVKQFSNSFKNNTEPLSETNKPSFSEDSNNLGRQIDEQYIYAEQIPGYNGQLQPQKRRRIN